MELGIYTFGDLLADPVTGQTRTFKQRLRETVELAKVADEVGLDVFAVGEHHRLDMAIASPAVVLAAAAEATQRIHLSSATTLLNTLDPVRVFEDFATLDLLSDGRAELILGRGSFTESFNLFGYDLEDYDDLFAEHLDLLLELQKNEVITWTKGKFRAPLHEAEVSPRPGRTLPLWIGVGGTPGSAARAGRLGIPLNLAILSNPAQFAPFVRLYRRAASEAGHDAGRLAVAVSSHGLLADDAEKAKANHAARWGHVLRTGLKNRMPPRDVSDEALAEEMGPTGAVYAGDAEDAIKKIRWEREVLGIDRLLLQVDFVTPHDEAVRAVEILGTEVAPTVRAEFGGQAPRPR